MPTPFMHLDIAGRMAQSACLPGAITRLLEEEQPAFYLGNVAPDFQTISDVPREVAHFYGLPPEPGVEAHNVMLERFPALADSSELPVAQAVFVAGYRAHLLLDLIWYRDVLIPFFVQAEDWPVDHRRRFLVHNILLTYLDRQAKRALPEEVGERLGAAYPRGWLPFAGDGDLIRWRDMLTRQLRPGARSETVTIYADRMKMSPAEFAAHLDDPEWMTEQVFSKVPLPKVDEALDKGLEASVAVVNDYLTPVA